MRLFHLIKGDISFQIKYGFYLLYGILTFIYTFILFVLPVEWRGIVSHLLIFSDPAAMGLFFMGAMILFEKSQRVLNSLAVSPVTTQEYIFSKMMSFAIISEIVAMILAYASHQSDLLLVFIGTLMTSFIFSLLGIIVSTQIQSLNQFILWTVPVEIVCFLPPAFSLFIDNMVFKMYPITHCLFLIRGESSHIILSMSMIIFTIACLWFIANHFTKQMFKRIGGVHL